MHDETNMPAKKCFINFSRTSGKIRLAYSSFSKSCGQNLGFLAKKIEMKMEKISILNFAHFFQKKTFLARIKAF